MLAVPCSADRCVAITLFGRLNEAWLRTFLALPNGSPSHDRLGRKSVSVWFLVACSERLLPLPRRN